MLPHCQQVFNNHKAVSPQALMHMKQRPINKALQNTPRQMKNVKAPGSNAVPIKALKAMDDTTFAIVCKFLRKFWNSKTDYNEWHSGTGTPIPKTVNPDDPNKFGCISNILAKA